MRKYSDSTSDRPATGQRQAPALTLAVDSGSPLVSVAFGAAAGLLAIDSYPGGPSSPPLLERINALLESIDCRPRQIQRMIGAQGPGSFTGLRSGLASLLGLHQALDIPATAVPSFLPLAAQAETSGRVVAAVDALRGEWYTQAFDTPSSAPCSTAAILSPQQILPWAPCRIVAFGSHRIAEALAGTKGVEVQEAQPLARDLLALAAADDLEWDPFMLTSPLYLRPPVVKP